MNEQAASSTTRARHSRGTVILEFLGSMNLAITLLVVIAIASVIGTVLQQHQPYTDYVIKFGPFWFEVFRTLGLYDIYGSIWFLVLLGFLLLSVSACVYRNGPQMIRDMRQFRLDVAEKSLRAFHHKAEWRVDASPELVRGAAGRLFTHRGFRQREKQTVDHRMVVGMKGAWNRVGYILSHVAIVVICIGGLVDGNLPLKVAEWQGRVEVETRDLPAAEVPDKSTLAADNPAFRGNVRIPEGSAADFVFLNVRDGYLKQMLPFKVELKEFRVAHYPSGQPKSFESDVVLHDPDLAEPIERTISVNHPLIHKGYAIYQASFSDGGSRLTMQAWPLETADAEPLALQGAVYQNLSLNTPRGQRTLELIDFQLYNIFPREDGSLKFRNFGPSLVFKLRNAAGEALEYKNYMAPVEQQGRLYYMSGMRSSPAQDYGYLYLPADAQGGLDRFLSLRRLAMNEQHVREVVDMQTAASGDDAATPIPQTELAEAIVRLTDLFVRGGMEALMAQVTEAVPEAERDQAMQSYLMVLQNVFGSLYLEVLEAEGVDLAKGISEADSAFFEDALQALSVLGSYGSPFFLQITDFEHVEASGLQITRAPGQVIVYLGFVMLMVGVFLMFYLHHRRIWLRLVPDGQGTRVLMAGSGNRDRADFDKEFTALKTELETLTRSVSATESTLAR